MQKSLFSTVESNSEIETDADRTTYVREWIGRRLKVSKTAGAGFFGAVLTLPALAVAQVAEGFVSASGLDGVRSVEVLDDGSGQIQMSNGTTIQVPAQDIQVAANGQVLVSPRIAEIAAEVMAAGAGGGALGTLGIAGAGAAAATAAVANGDSGSDAGAAPAGAAATTSVPTVNAAVLSASSGLTNGNTGITLPEDTATIEITVTDSDGGTVTTTVTPDEDGNWRLAAPEDGFPEGEVEIVVNSFDADGEETGETTGNVIIDTVPPTIEITDAGVGKDNIMTLADLNDGFTISGTTDAEDGQEVTVTIRKLSGEDHVETTVVSGGAWSVGIEANDITGGTPPGLAGYPFDGQTIEIEANVEDAAGNAATGDIYGITADLTGPSITIDTISGDDQIGLLEANDSNGLTITGTTSAEIGQAVTLTFAGTEYPGEVVSAAQDEGLFTWIATVPQSAIIALQDAAGEDELITGVEISATVSELSGNPAPTAATTTVDADFSGPSISISAITEDDVINSSDATSDVTISGVTNNVGEGQTVSVTVNGSALDDVQTLADGSWQVTLPQADAAALPEGSAIAVTAAVSDADGIPANASSSITADFTSPTVTIDTISEDDIINIADSEQALTISGSSTDAEEGQMVSLGLPGLDVQMAPVGTDGTWSLTLTPEQTAQLVAEQDGSILDITANLSDAAGNPATEDPRSVAVDLTAPVITITEPLDDDGTLNALESGSDLTVNGTASDTDSVNVTINGTGPTAVAVSDGNWTIDIPSTTLQGLTDGGTLQITAEGSDTSGNSGSDEASLNVDFTPPTVTIASVSTEDTLTIDELAGGMTLTGTASEEAVGTSVTVSLNGTDFVTPEPVQEDGSWTLTLAEADITALNLADQTDFDLTATASDAVGNISDPATFTITTDFQPIITIDPIGTDGALDLSNLGTPQITGTVLGLEDGQGITIWPADATDVYFNEQAAIVQPDGTWAFTIPQATLDEMDAGETFIVNASVSMGGQSISGATEQAQADLYLPAVFGPFNSSENGPTLSISVLANESLVATDGIQTTMTFDPSLATYVTGSDSNDLDLFIVNADDAGSGSIVFSGGTLFETRAEGDFLYGFDINDQGAGPITLNFNDANQGGQTELQIGTSSADTLVSAKIDSILQGRGGDDILDMSATGTNVVLFDIDQATNGTDTITGFTTGDTFQSDIIAFPGQVDLRGAGDTVEALADGGTLGANTGFVVFTTALANTLSGTLETAFEGLTGETGGDIVYFLAGDGEDAALIRTQTNAPDDASVEVMAQFVGIGDLSNLSLDNIALPDPLLNT